MKLFTLSILTLIFFSCSITKRQILPGYNLKWKTKVSFQNNENLNYVKYDANYSEFKTKKKINETSIDTNEMKCDTIFFLDGSSILGKIIRQDSKIIEYKSCEEESSFINKVYKSKIKSITYSNGYIYKIETKDELVENRKNKVKSHTEKVKENKNSNTLKNDDRKILKNENITQKEKNIEKNGRNSILLFALGLLVIIAYPLFLFYFWMGILSLIFFVVATIFFLISLSLALESLKIMSKNPELYILKDLILFVSILDIIFLIFFTIFSISLFTPLSYFLIILN